MKDKLTDCNIHDFFSVSCALDPSHLGSHLKALSPTQRVIPPDNRLLAIAEAIFFLCNE